jgi:hypothetical protein
MDIVLMLSYILQHDIEHFNEKIVLSFLHDEAVLTMIKYNNCNGTK